MVPLLHSYHASYHARRLRLVLALALLTTAVLAGAALGQEADAPVVEVVEVEGLIDPTVAAALVDTIEEANATGAALVALTLDSPGGFGGAAPAVIEAIERSEVPVLAYVGPAGARAAGTAAAIANAADVLAASPVTQLGAVRQLELDDGADSAPPAEALAEVAQGRGRNAEFARAMAVDNRVLAVLPEGGERGDVPQEAVVPGGDVLALLPREAIEQGLLDVVEPSLSAVLEVLGQEGSDIALDGERASVRFHNLGVLQQVLHTVANPTLAYLLLVAGALALAFELFQPGFGVAGGSGLLLAALGLYGFVVLPGNPLGLVLLVAGVALLALDLAVGGFGFVTTAGGLAFAAGSWLLFPGPWPLRLSPWLIAAVTVFTVGFFVVIMTVVLRAQGAQARAGAEHLVGKTGVVRSVLNPEGHVFVDGALWRARAPESVGRVKTGTPVRVVQLDDQLTLDVELAGAAVQSDSSLS